MAEISTRAVGAAAGGAVLAVALAFATSSDSSERSGAQAQPAPVVSPQSAGVK